VGLISWPRGPESQGFTLGWVRSALQAEAQGAGPRCVWRVAEDPRVLPSAGFLRPFRPPQSGALRGPSPLGARGSRACAKTDPPRPVKPTAAGQQVDEVLLADLAGVPRVVDSNEWIGQRDRSNQESRSRHWCQWPSYNPSRLGGGPPESMSGNRPAKLRSKTGLDVPSRSR
jgi:hypothetical protein